MEQRLSQVEAQINDVQNDVKKVNTELGKLNLNQALYEEKQSNRAEILTSKVGELRDTGEILRKLIEEQNSREQKRIEEASAYRRQREEQERQASLARQQWAQQLLSPQTIVLVLAIFLSILGVRLPDIAHFTGALQPAPTAPAPISTEQP